MTVPRDTEPSSEEPGEPEEEITMFITVRYGENKEQIFNPNCLNKVLLENIKERCGCQLIDTVDLSDEDGKVKNLNSCLKEYGTGYFTNREKLILLKVEKQHEVRGENDIIRTTFTPLLAGMEEDKEFLGKINPKPTKSKRDQKSPAADNKDKKRNGSQDMTPNQQGRRRSSIKNPRLLKKFQKLGQAAVRSKNM